MTKIPKPKPAKTQVVAPARLSGYATRWALILPASPPKLRWR